MSMNKYPEAYNFRTLDDLTAHYIKIHKLVTNVPPIVLVTNNPYIDELYRKVVANKYSEPIQY